MLVEGQIIGGTVQGVGGGMFEGFVYDNEGQLLTGSLMDYLAPTASDVPDIALVHLQSPTSLNPLGVKGLGEGGAIAPPVAIANAVCDALAPFGAELNSTPVVSGAGRQDRATEVCYAAQEWCHEPNENA